MQDHFHYPWLIVNLHQAIFSAVTKHLNLQHSVYQAHRVALSNFPNINHARGGIFPKIRTAAVGWKILAHPSDLKGRACHLGIHCR